MVILMMAVSLRVPVRWTFLHSAFGNPSLLIADHEADDDDDESKGKDNGDWWGPIFFDNRDDEVECDLSKYLFRKTIKCRSCSKNLGIIIRIGVYHP